MTIAQSIIAVANKVSEILTEINTAITSKGGSSVNCLDDVATAVEDIPSPPKNNIVITDSYGDRTIYFDGYASGGEKYDTTGIKADTVKALNYGDITQIYAIYGNSAHSIESLYLPCFKGVGASAETYYGTIDALVNCEVGSVAYPQTYNGFQQIFGILYNNTDVATLTVYIDTTDSDYAAFVEELEAIAEGMTDCTLTIYDVTNGEAVLHGGE